MVKWDMIPEQVIDRFWSKVDATGPCWEWTKTKTRTGYGSWTVGSFPNKKTYATHRLSWEILVGDIPAGMELDHLCRVRHCLNPDHLEVVTRSENMLRAGATGSANRRKTHCPQGHEYSGENIYMQISNGRRSRSCMICRRDANSRRSC